MQRLKGYSAHQLHRTLGITYQSGLVPRASYSRSTESLTDQLAQRPKWGTLQEPSSERVCEKCDSPNLTRQKRIWPLASLKKPLNVSFKR